MSKICIVRRAYYPAEYHVRRNAETLRRSGHSVDVVCLKDEGQKFVETINNIRIYRIPLKTSRTGIIHYAIEYTLFFLMAFVVVTMLQLRNFYDYLEADSMPDFLIFCGLVPKLTGTKLILYLFESMPELWAQKKNLSFDSWPIRMLGYHESLSCRFADKVVCCHKLAKKAVVSRGIPVDKVIDILNVPDETLFNSNICDSINIGDRLTETINIVQHGTITENYGIQCVIKALALLKGTLPIKYHICGRGEFQSHLEKLAAALEVTDMVIFHGYVSYEELVKILCSADVGIVPMLFEYQSPNKMFELISLGKPVIASNLETFKQHFSDKSIIFFKTGDIHDIAKVLIQFSHLSPVSIRKKVDMATKEYEQYRWHVMQKRYLSIYNAI